MNSDRTDTNDPLGDSRGNLSVLRLLDLALRHRWLVLLVTLGMAALIVTWAAIRPIPWTAESRFMPAGSTTRDASGLRGLAGQFGIDLSGMDSGESLEFYAELVKSPDLLRSLAQTEFEISERQAAPRRVRLAEIIGASGDTEEERVREAIRMLQDQLVLVSLQKQAGLVNIATIASDASVAAAMNRRLLDLVAEFNMEKRQSQAAEERRFANNRLEAARAELESAESALRRFMEQNRQVRSPNLILEQARLERRVSMIQQVYTSLAQSYEQARINEVRNTPVITVIDQPEGMVERADRKIPLFVVAGLLFGFTVAIAIVLVLTTLDSQLTGGQRYPEVARVYRTLRRRRQGPPALRA